jgi:predicted TIM-barrel fold metal-dependent hydrolase
MIIDCHFHVDETMLTLDKMIEGMDRNNIAKTALIAPMNETMFESSGAIQHQLQRFFRYLLLNEPQTGLKTYDRLIKEGQFKAYGHTFQIYQKPNNNLVADAIERYPERFLGWVAVNPTIPETIAEIDYYLRKPGFIGVKAHPFMHQYPIHALDPIADYCEAKGKPMLIHLSSETDSYQYLPEKYPNLKLVYAHAGLPFWKKLWRYIQDKPNVYVDTSSDYLNSSIVKMAVESLGYEKVLFGCDGPYGMKTFNEYDYSHKKSWVEELYIHETQKQYIFGKNFLRLIDFAN